MPKRASVVVGNMTKKRLKYKSCKILLDEFQLIDISSRNVIPNRRGIL